MKNQPIAIVSLGYWIKLAVPLKDLSKVTELLSSYDQVETSYVDGESVTYITDSPRKLSVDIVDAVLPVKPEEPAKEQEVATEE